MHFRSNLWTVNSLWLLFYLGRGRGEAGYIPRSENGDGRDLGYSRSTQDGWEQV